MKGSCADALHDQDGDSAAERLCLMATFRDGEASRRQIGTQLDQAQADFARCLAMSGWAIVRPLRLIVFGLPMRASLDDCLLARLHDAGYELGGLGDEAIRPCLDSRWEFVRGNEYRPARYRPAPSYHERLRVELLIAAWQRASRGPTGVGAIESIARSLATATAALAAHLALPIALLRRAAAERLLDAAAQERLHRQVRKGLLEFAEHDIAYLAIMAALDGAGDIVPAVRRYGTASMQVLLRAHVERMSQTGARTALEPRLARLRRELWAPIATCG
jgi:hypothetical protein